MKFYEQYKHYKVPEYYDEYFNYEDLHQMIQSASYKDKLPGYFFLDRTESKLRYLNIAKEL